MLSDEIESALNEQITAELASSHTYLSMAAYYEEEGLAGFAGWMRSQAEEERAHAMRLYQYVVDRDGRVRLGGLDAPPVEWSGPVDAFESAYQHEVKISGMIDDLVALAREHNDNATETMLEWFVAEQVEEEATAQGILDRLQRVGDDGTGLLLVDQELGQRGGDAAPPGEPEA